MLVVRLTVNRDTVVRRACEHECNWGKSRPWDCGCINFSTCGAATLLQRAYFGASIAGHAWLKGLFICSVSTQPGPDKPTLRKQAMMDAPPGFGGPKACVPLMELHQPDCRNILRTP